MKNVSIFLLISLLCTSALSDDSREIQSQFNDAMTLLSSGNAYEAAEILSELALQTSSPRILLELGRALYQDNRLEESKVVFKKVLLIKGIPWEVEEKVYSYINLIEQQTGSISFSIELITDSNPQLNTSAKKVEMLGGWFDVSQDTNPMLIGLRYSLLGQLPLSDQGKQSGALQVSLSDYPDLNNDSINTRLEIQSLLSAYKAKAIRVGIEAGFSDDKKTFEMPYVGLNFGSRSRLSSWSINLKTAYMDAKQNFSQSGVRNSAVYSYIRNLPQGYRLTSSLEASYSGAVYAEDKFATFSIRENYGIPLGLRSSRLELFGKGELRQHEGMNFIFGDIRDDKKLILGANFVGQGYRFFGMTPKFGISYTNNQSNLAYYSYDKYEMQLSFSK